MDLQTRRVSLAASRAVALQTRCRRGCVSEAVVIKTMLCVLVWQVKKSLKAKGLPDKGSKTELVDMLKVRRGSQTSLLACPLLVNGNRSAC